MFWRNGIMENYPNTNEEVNYRTPPTQGMLTTVYRYLDIPMKKYTYNPQRRLHPPYLF